MGAGIHIFYIIDGEWVTPCSTSIFEIRSWATGEPVGSVAGDVVRTVCQRNVAHTRNELPRTRRNGLRRQKRWPR
jgi:hypothetical protein